MPNKRDLNLNKFNISKNRYRELKYFCLQYDEWKQELNNITSAVKSPVITGMPNGNITGDTTGNLAIKRADLKRCCELIEESANEVDKFLSRWIIKSVAQGTSFEYLDVPCSRATFNRCRKKFFYILANKKYNYAA